MIKLLVISALTLAALRSAPLPICALVTAADATTILGAPAKQTHDPSGCGWEDSTFKKSLTIAYFKVAAMFEGARADSATTGTVQDEKGLGGPAFSTVATTHKGGKVELYCLKQSTVLIITVEADGAPSRLPQMRDIMRKLNPKP